LPHSRTQVLLHCAPATRRRLLGRALRALLPWCATQNNSLRTFALLNMGRLLEELGAPSAEAAAALAAGGSSGGSGDSGGSDGAAAAWVGEFGPGGVALLQQVGLRGPWLQLCRRVRATVGAVPQKKLP
jgi:hypothetical protein